MGKLGEKSASTVARAQGRGVSRAHGMLRHSSAVGMDHLTPPPPPPRRRTASGGVSSDKLDPHDGIKVAIIKRHVEEDEESTPAAQTTTAWETTPNNTQKNNSESDGDGSAARSRLDKSGGGKTKWPDPLALESSAPKGRSKWESSHFAHKSNREAFSPTMNSEEDTTSTSHCTMERTVLKEQVLLMQSAMWPRSWVKCPAVLFSDWSIAYYQDKAGRILGLELDCMKLTARSSARMLDEEGRFCIMEGSGRDLVWTFEANSHEEAEEWVQLVSTNLTACFPDTIKEVAANECTQREPSYVSRQKERLQNSRNSKLSKSDSGRQPTRHSAAKDDTWERSDSSSQDMLSTVNPAVKLNKHAKTQDVRLSSFPTSREGNKEVDKIADMSDSTKSKRPYSEPKGHSPSRARIFTSPLNMLSARVLRERIMASAESLAGLATPVRAPEKEKKSSECKYVRALFAYDSLAEGELDLKEGDIVNVLKEHDSGWWQGEVDGLVGW